MEILENFGLNPMLLIAQIVNFLIVLFILKKFLYKPVLEMLKKRQTTIKDGLKQAEEALGSGADYIAIGPIFKSNFNIINPYHTSNFDTISKSSD